jgi:urate oxidase
VTAVSIVLGENRYGKAETRVVRVDRHADRHEIVDLTVSTALAGDFAGTYLTGDNAAVLPTDSQKNAVYALAAEHGIGEPEAFGLRLARYFVDSQPAVEHARVTIEQHAWSRVAVAGSPAPHSFQRTGGETRLAMVTCGSGRAWVVSGLADLVLLNSAGSEFAGFATDRFTTLAETRDRILATAVDARWRHATERSDWSTSYADVRRHLIEAFAATHSLSLQQTLYAMGRRVLEHCLEVVEVRLRMPNRHHVAVDLTPFGLDNRNDVFVALDRPYGLIEGTVLRGDGPDPGLAW